MSLPVVDRTELEQLFTEGRPVVVDFYADWCRPCHAIAPEMERIAESFPDVAVVKLDVDAQPDLARELGVMGIPTVIHFGPGGDEVARTTGAARAPQLAERLRLGG